MPFFFFFSFFSFFVYGVIWLAGMGERERKQTQHIVLCGVVSQSSVDTSGYVVLKAKILHFFFFKWRDINNVNIASHLIKWICKFMPCNQCRFETVYLLPPSHFVCPLFYFGIYQNIILFLKIKVINLLIFLLYLY